MTGEFLLEIRRMFQAPRERIYRAWTEREQLEQWMCKDIPSQQATYVELDVRPGGRYAIELRSSDEDMYIGQGVFHEVEPPVRLVFTWSWFRVRDGKEERLQDHDSLITLKFLERGSSTELVLLQERLESTASRNDHQKGWDGCFEILAKLVEPMPVQEEEERRGHLAQPQCEEEFRIWEDSAAWPEH